MSRSGTQRFPVTDAWPASVSDVPSILELVPLTAGEDRDLPGAADRILKPIVEDLLEATHASGAALALDAGGTIVCCARAGDSAPSLGAELDRESGISGLCLRTGQTVRCEDANSDPRVDAEAARNLGICSVLAVPLTLEGATVGLLEVFSESPYAFGDPEEAAVREAAGRVLSVLSGDQESKPALDPAPEQVENPVAEPAPTPPVSILGLSEVVDNHPSAAQPTTGRRLAMLLSALGLIATVAIGISLRTGHLQLNSGQPQPVVEQSKPETAMERLVRTAEQGDASAQYEFAMHYRQGDGVPRDNNEAVRWLQEAARQGSADAQYELGNAYADGHGVPRDPINAYACYVLAAANGNSASDEALKFLTPKLSDAQIAQVRSTIAEMYVQGRGTPTDYVAAYTWFTLAEAAGSADSQRAKASLASKMTKAEIATANRRASDWLKRHAKVTP